MQMRPQIQIKSVLKALTDVVLPAVDPHNKPAQEQLRLAIGMLGLMAQQLPLQFRFDWDELTRLLRFSDELQGRAQGGAQTQAALSQLAEAAQAAADTLDGAKTAPDQIETRIRQLRSATSAVITQAYKDGDPSCRDGVRDSVLAMSQQQLLRDRSWLLTQGWEPDPQSIPAVASLLSAGSKP